MKDVRGPFQFGIHSAIEKTRRCKAMQSFSSSFMCDFPTSDNVHYNLIDLAELYRIKRTRVHMSHSGSIIKPKIMIISSCIEAILYDFFQKASRDKRSIARASTVDLKKFVKAKTFYSLIESLKDLDSIFTESLIEDLDEVRLIRNRIHLQRRPNMPYVKDRRVFTEQQLSLSERSLESLLITVTENFSRNLKKSYTKSYQLPWTSYDSRF